MIVNQKSLAQWAGGVLAIAAATGLVACGGGGGSDSADESSTTKTAAAPTKAEYIASADKACAATTKENQSLAKNLARAVKSENAALASGGSISADLGKLSGLYTQIASVRDQLTSELEDLPAPEQGAPESYLRSRDQVTTAVEQSSKTLKDVADAPTQQAVAAQSKAAKRVNAASKRSRALAKAYGFKSCEAPLKA